jgi:zinc protease
VPLALAALGLVAVAGCAADEGAGPAGNKKVKDPYDLGHPIPAQAHLGIARTHLDNGLELIVNEDHSSPLVAVVVLYRVGSANEDKGKYGLAHLIEHLMFDGTAHSKGSDAFDKLTLGGASYVNAFTESDFTVYHELVPRGTLELALWVESERMGFHVNAITQATLDRERRVVENELRQNHGSDRGMAMRVVHEAIYPEGHPYRHLPIGTLEDLDSVTLADVQSFEKRHYLPNNATIAIVGDVRAQEAQALVQKYFAEIPAGPLPPSVDAPEPKLTSEKRILMEADVTRAYAIVAWPLPRGYAPGMAELRVGSRLGYFIPGSDSDAALSWSDIDVGDQGGMAMLFAKAAPGKAPTDALDELDKEMHTVRAQSDVIRFDRVKFAISRAHILTDTVANLEAFDGRAITMAEDAYYAGDPGFVDRRLADVRAVRPRDIQDAAYQFMPFDGRVVALVYPNKNAPATGRLKGGGK